jgi:GINS complex subunit 1
MERVNRLQALRWDVGAVLPPELKENLSQHESTFFQSYNRNLGTYMESVGLDLSAVCV